MLFHQGFDQFERMFTSIPEKLSISPMSVCELGPEHFLCPEMFENINGIVLHDGASLPMEFPRWASNCYSFVEFHRYALESYPIRSRINEWIDLVFGYKSQGIEGAKALNLFNPLGYLFVPRTPEEETLRNEWIQTCGQLPHQILSQPFPEFKHVHASGDVEVVLGDGFVRESKRIFTGSRFVVKTKNTGIVTVHRILQSGIEYDRKQAVFLRRNVKFSVLNESQLICASICEREIVIWSIINSSVLFIVEVENARFLVFDEKMNTFYAATKSALFQFSLTGKKLRQRTFGEMRITALAIFGMDFTFDHRLAIIGMADGTVHVVAGEFEGGQLLTLQISKLSEFPIEKITMEDGSRVITAFDSRSGKPTLLYPLDD
jgi:hypothetical protein